MSTRPHPLFVRFLFISPGPASPCCLTGHSACSLALVNAWITTAPSLCSLLSLPFRPSVSSSAPPFSSPRAACCLACPTPFPIRHWSDHTTQLYATTLFLDLSPSPSLSLPRTLLSVPLPSSSSTPPQRSHRSPYASVLSSDCLVPSSLSPSLYLCHHTVFTLQAPHHFELSTSSLLRFDC